MPAKTKITNNTRGRPKKEFKAKPKKVTTVKRGRGRPKKDTSIKKTDNISTRISKHGNDIKKISQNHKKIHLEIKNSTFFSKKIKKDKNTKSDKFALGLLIFSMLLFIFSLYKTFYLTQYDADTNFQVDTDILIDTGTTIIHDVSELEGIGTINTQETSNNTDYVVSTNKVSKDNIIKMFYDKINEKNYIELPAFADNYMKASSLFKVYYADNRLGNFLSNLTNERVYITNVQEIIGESTKEGVTYYSYIIKYKLKNNNELFVEKWKAAIVTRNEKKLIGSLQCTNVGCSKMPFFNPEKHGIK